MERLILFGYDSSNPCGAKGAEQGRFENETELSQFIQDLKISEPIIDWVEVLDTQTGRWYESSISDILKAIEVNRRFLQSGK